jgi:hypothetical protein
MQLNLLQFPNPLRKSASVEYKEQQYPNKKGEDKAELIESLIK